MPKATAQKINWAKFSLNSLILGLTFLLAPLKTPLRANLEVKPLFRGQAKTKHSHDLTFLELNFKKLK